MIRDSLDIKKDAARLDVECDRCGKVYYTDAKAVRYGTYNVLCPKCRGTKSESKKDTCQAITKSGKRCKFGTSFGSEKYCYVHTQRGVARSVETVSFSNKEDLYNPNPTPCISISSITGKPCLNYALTGEKHCFKHLTEMENKRKSRR